MLKMTIDNEEVLSNNDISIKEEILSPSSTILNNVYPKSWELDKDYTSRFYYPKDYSKLNIQNFSIEPEEAGKTIQVNGSATLTDVDTSKESRVLRLLGQTSQTGTPTPSSPIPINVVSGDNTINICGKNLLDKSILELFSSNKYVKTPDYNTKGSIIVKANTTYTLSSQNITFTDINVFEFDENNNRTTLVKHTITQQHSFWFTTSATSKTISFYSNNNGLEMPSDLDFQVEVGNQATTYEPYIGHSYPLYLGVENLFDKDNIEIGKFYVSNGTSTSTNWAISQVPVKPNTSYYLSGNNYNNAGAKIVLLDSSMNILQDLGSYNVVHSITTTSATAYVGLSIAIYSGASDLDSIVIEIGSKANHPSTTPIELCKIGTYQDYIYKDNGSWYLHKEIGKVVLNGSESWSKSSTTSIDRFFITLENGTFSDYRNVLALSDKFLYNTQLNIKLNYMQLGAYQNDTRLFIDYSTYNTTTLAQFKTWLSNNQPIVYYVLATPTNTEITDTTLLEQLESLSS